MKENNVHIFVFKTMFITETPRRMVRPCGLWQSRVPLRMPRRRILSNGLWCRQQPPTVGSVQVCTEWMEAFSRVREARWRRHASCASVANYGSVGLEAVDVLELNPEYCLVLSLHMLYAPFPMSLEAGVHLVNSDERINRGHITPVRVGPRNIKKWECLLIIQRNV